MVVDPDTGLEPWTVVIEPVHTLPALVAMLRSIASDHFTLETYIVQNPRSVLVRWHT